MSNIITPDQMRALEAAALEEGSVTGLQLMERAGRGVVCAAFDAWPELASGAHHAVVLCGPGNNGGDGFVIARLLQAKGWTVDVLALGEAESLPPDARRNHDIWRANGGQVTPLTARAAATGPRPALAVDAMFGLGLSRAIPLDCASAWHAVRARAPAAGDPSPGPVRCVAVDCVSGLDAASGRFLLPAPPETVAQLSHDDAAYRSWWATNASPGHLECDLTVTFHARKPCHILGGQGGVCAVVDLGLGQSDARGTALTNQPMQREMPAAKHLTAPETITSLDLLAGDPRQGWPAALLKKRVETGAHKFDHGHALVLAGGAGRTGAARLAARAALRIGAGLVTLGVPREAKGEVAAQITSVMMQEVTQPEQLRTILNDRRITAVCLGPGLGLERARALVEVAVRAQHAPYVVLDADALSCFASDPSALFEMLGAQNVLTPHGGEFARLFPDISDRLAESPVQGPAFSKIDAARAASVRAGCTVLFKGVDTVIARPDGAVSVHTARGTRSAPWLATAGSGDVLTGFIAGLMARGIAPFEAAEVACWLHVTCAQHVGPGLIAEDLPDAVRPVFAALQV